jgi:hypothetical protein
MSKPLFVNPKYYLQLSTRPPYKHEAKRREEARRREEAKSRAINAVKEYVRQQVEQVKQIDFNTREQVKQTDFNTREQLKTVDSISDPFRTISPKEKSKFTITDIDLKEYTASGIKETTKVDLKQSVDLRLIPNDDYFQRFLLSKLFSNSIYEPSIDTLFQTKFSSEFNSLLHTFCSYIFRLICIITVVAHGGSSRGHSGTNPTTMSAIFVNNPIIKTNVSALGCPTFTTKPERFMLASILSKVLDNIPNVVSLNRKICEVELKDTIVELLEKNALLQEYLKSTQPLAQCLADNSTTEDMFNKCISSRLTFEQCQTCQVGETYDSKTHISNRLYGLSDPSKHKKIAIIYITFFFIDNDGNIRQLTKELRILFNHLGEVLDEDGNPIGILFESIFLSDLLKPNYTFLRFILQHVYGCTEEQINMLILTLIIMLFDASCGGENTVHTVDNTKIFGGKKTKNKKTSWGGKTTNKKRKAKRKTKNKKQKTKKRKTKNN